MAPEIENIIQPILYLVFHRVYHVNKTCTQSSDLCGAVSYSSWNCPHSLVVKLVILVCRIIGSDHIRNLIWTPVLCHCFGSPKRGWDFWVLPRLIMIRFMFLRECFVRNHTLFFRFFNISAYNLVLCVNQYLFYRVLHNETLCPLYRRCFHPQEILITAVYCVALISLEVAP